MELRLKLTTRIFLHIEMSGITVIFIGDANKLIKFVALYNGDDDDVDDACVIVGLIVV